jgi:hypothetical protein
MNFSQSSLKSFLDCQKYFELRHIKKLDWPGSNPMIPPALKIKIDQGKQFHEFTHLYFSGTRPEKITDWIKDPEISVWWKHFESSVIPKLAHKQILSEQTLEIPIDDHKLIAIFDAICIHPNQKIEIFDWKISKKPRDVTTIPKLIQTRVYFQVLWLGYLGLKQVTNLDFQSLSMTYWFADDKDPFFTQTYSKDQFKDDQQYLANLLQQVKSCMTTSYKMTDRLELCTKCHYRGFCHHKSPQISMDEYDDYDQYEDETWLNMDQGVEY